MKPPTSICLTASFAIVISVGCQQQPSTPTDSSTSSDSWQIIAESDMTPSVTAQQERAESAKQALATRLKDRLTEVASNQGPVAAIKVCSEEAPEIAAQVSEEHQLEIGRTSFRLRNANNQPPSWAESLVANRVEQPTFLTRDGKLAAFLPIKLQAQCVLCHGPQEDLLPQVADALATHYPTDEATGFQAGDLRGWFWIEVPATADSKP